MSANIAIFALRRYSITTQVKPWEKLVIDKLVIHTNKLLYHNSNEGYYLLGRVVVLSESNIRQVLGLWFNRALYLYTNMYNFKA